METAELIKKVRRIEIKTRGLSQHIFAGEYHSAFKGRGMAFSEVREYQYGDDIRNIDWNVTARFNHPFVKVFEEERELTVMLLIDVSGSHDFGSINQFKKNLITEVAAVLAFSAIQNNDKIGAVLFSSKVEKFIPPKKGKQHILRIIRELIDFVPEHKGTNLSEGIRYFTNMQKKRSTAFLISDFIDNGFEDALKVASKKHDLIALRVSDRREQELPPVGMIYMKDAESGHNLWVDSSSRSVREAFKNFWDSQKKLTDALFQKYGIDKVDIDTQNDYIKPLVTFFKKRI
ncbi:MAG: DUF58 domain-containing protein [Bacteroidales bacterium]|nr:DUF58 domain-containing protein [Bacteroidales bacterium]